MVIGRFGQFDALPPPQLLLWFADGTAVDGDGLEEVINDLDENPDFYVWLASGDADVLAM